MYSIQSCPQGQPFLRNAAHDTGIVLTLRENRSALSQDARVTFTVLIGLFMAMAILPATKGAFLVPLFSLGTMALLVGALEWHKRSRPAAECVAISGDCLRWSSHEAEPVELPLHATRLIQQETAQQHRLFLKCRGQKIEIGRCLSLEEKRAVAVVIARALGEADA